MAGVDLRPLSLGEILDRTFSLYRRHFLLFLVITVLPYLLIPACILLSSLLPAAMTTTTVGAAQPRPSVPFIFMVLAIVVVLPAVLIGLGICFLAQGASVYAVSELYFGRTTTIAACLRRVRGRILNLFGVALLNGLAVVGAFLLFVIPGVWLGCRLITCIPAALLENLGPGDALSRSFRLTKGSAGRAFVIYLLFFVLFYMGLLISIFSVAIATGAFTRDSATAGSSGFLVGEFLALVLVTPFLSIATTVFYYDLRVRKEALDLQLMMNPGGTAPAPSSGTLPSMLLILRRVSVPPQAPRVRHKLGPPGRVGATPHLSRGVTRSILENVQGYWFLYQSCPSVHHFRANHCASVKGSMNAHRQLAQSASLKSGGALPTSRPRHLALAIRPNLASLIVATELSGSNMAPGTIENCRNSNRHLAIRNRRNSLKIKERCTF